MGSACATSSTKMASKLDSRARKSMPGGFRCCFMRTHDADGGFKGSKPNDHGKTQVFDALWGPRTVRTVWTLDMFGVSVFTCWASSRIGYGPSHAVRGGRKKEGRPHDVQGGRIKRMTLFGPLLLSHVVMEYRSVQGVKSASSD